jgi:hypothetical protein
MIAPWETLIEGIFCAQVFRRRNAGRQGLPRAEALLRCHEKPAGYEIGGLFVPLRRRDRRLTADYFVN